MRLSLGLWMAAVCCYGQSGTEYVFGFLRANPSAAKIERERVMEIQKGHMAHLGKMARDGILVAAGPLGTSPDLRGVVIFAGVSLEKVRAAAEEDPAVANGRLILDLAPWTGPAGIGQRVAEAMGARPAEKIPMTTRALVVYWRTPEMPVDFTGPERETVLKEHLAFARKLQEDGGVLALGALRGSKDFYGIAVYESADTEAALLRCREQDPFVKRGWVRPEGLTWYVAEDTFATP